MNKYACQLLCAAVAFAAFGTDYFPLVVGNTWDHDIQIENNGALQDIGVATWTITGTQQHDGKTYFVTEVIGDYYYGMLKDTSQVWLLSEGNDVFITTDLESESAHVKAGQHSYAGGESWQAGTKDITVESAGSVNVVAGSFDRCYAQKADGETVGLFAPDVGPLKMMLIKDDVPFYFLLKNYQVDVPLADIVIPMRPEVVPAEKDLFCANNLTGTVAFDLGNDRRAVLSVYRTDGRLVKEYQIGGMGTVSVNDNKLGSGNFVLKLELDGKVYTGTLSQAK